MVETVRVMIERMKALGETLSDAGPMMASPILPEFPRPNNSTVNNISNNNRPVEIRFGDTIINGASPDGVEQYKGLTRQMKNEIGRWLLNR